MPKNTKPIKEIIDNLVAQLQDEYDLNEKQNIINQLMEIHNASATGRRLINNNRKLSGYLVQIQGQERREDAQIKAAKSYRQGRSLVNRQKYARRNQQEATEKQLRELRQHQQQQERQAIQQQMQKQQMQQQQMQKQQSPKSPKRKPKKVNQNDIRKRNQQTMRKAARQDKWSKRRYKKTSPEGKSTRKTSSSLTERRRSSLNVNTDLKQYRSVPNKEYKYVGDYSDNLQNKPSSKKSNSQVARAPSPRELARLLAEEERQKKLHKQKEKERKQREQTASPGKKPPALKKKEIEDTDRDIKEFEDFLSSLKLNDDPKKEKVKPNDIKELLAKLKLEKKSPSPNMSSLVNHPTIKKVSATIKTVKNKNAFRNLLNRFRKHARQTLKLKKPKTSPGKMKAPPPSPDDEWLKQGFINKKPSSPRSAKNKKQSSPRSAKKQSSPSSLKSNETYDESPTGFIADPPPPPPHPSSSNESFYSPLSSSSPPPPPPLERKSQPYSTRRLTPSPKEGSPIEKYKPRRGATPHMKSVGEWGLDRVIDDIEKEEKLNADSSPKKSAKPKSSRAYRPRNSKSSRGWGEKARYAR